MALRLRGRLSLGFMAACLIAVSGCGGLGAPSVVKVSGVAKYDDPAGTPLAVGQGIEFIPVNPTSDQKITIAGTVMDEGKYSLTTSYKDGSVEGAPVGRYKVVVSLPPSVGGEESGPKPKAEVTDANTTKYEVEVTGATTSLDLKVPRE